MRLCAAALISLSLFAGASQRIMQAGAAVPRAPAPASIQDTQRVIIMRSGSQPAINGSPPTITGSARIVRLFQASDPSRMSVSSVTFEPGARTAWHTHVLGQILIVTAGAGWIQAWGGPVEEIRQGDVIWTPPGVKHWHGATRTTGMTHLAIVERRDGQVVEWMEQVSDSQYRR